MKRGLFILLLVALCPLVAKAQWTFDVVSIEAYINDHKQQRSLLLARSTLEHSNKLLHQYSSREVHDYKELNVDLDKYTRAFDVIDVMYQSLRTALNARSTYNSVSERIGDYKTLLTDFNEKIIRRGRIEPADTMLLYINVKFIEDVLDDSKQLYRSLTDLVLYATGAAACSTADLVMVLDEINYSMDEIERKINRSYFETWRFVELRLGYWKEKVYRKKTKYQVAIDAFQRWRDAGYL